MRRDDARFEGDTEFGEEVSGDGQGRPIGVAAHDDPDEGGG
jgi:hypothetical protein